MVDFLVVIGLVVLNAFFALSEMSLMTSRKSRLKQMAVSSRRSAQALALMQHPENFLSTVQIGITLIGILNGLFGGDAIALQIASALHHFFPNLDPYTATLSKVIAVFVITCLTLVLGELVPKRLALTRSETIAGYIALPMGVLARIAAPGVWILSKSTRLIMRMLGLGNQQAAKVTEEEIRILVAESHEAGLINVHERDMLNRVMRLSQRTADSMMTPRNRIAWLDMALPISDQLDFIRTTGFSRYPVYRENDQEIVGILEIKSLVWSNGPASMLIVDKLTEPLFVSESTHALKLLEIFREEQQSIALVVDEYGEIQGLVTLSDLMGAVIGRLQAVENHQQDALVVKRDDGSMLIDGSLPIQELCEVLGFAFSPPEDADYHTLAGMCIQHFGRIPQTGEYFHLKGWRIEIVDLDGARIDKLLVRPHRAEDK